MTVTGTTPEATPATAPAPIIVKGLVQLVQVDGERMHGSPFADLVADVGAEELRSLYRDLVVVRRIDAEATALQRQGELGLWASLLGQEAAQVGSGRALREQDMA